MSKPHARRLGGPLLVCALLALPLGLTAQVASAQCADPRGNSYCSNGGQVTFSTQPAKPQPAPPQVTIHNPDPGQVPVHNPDPGQVPVHNPDPGQVTFSTQPAPQPAAPASQPDLASAPQADASITVDPPTASSGDTVTVTGQGLGGPRTIAINLAGLPLGAKQLDTADGSTPTTANDGTFLATFTIPDLPAWESGDVQICVFGNPPVCTPFSVQGNIPDSSAGATADASSGGSVCLPCQNVENFGDRLFGHYNSGSGNYEYNGARP